MEELTIGDVAERAGLQTSAIRYYERIGLLPKPKRVNGRRRYDDEVLKQLTIIRMAKDAGFSIEDIQTLLTGFPEGTPASERWQELAQKKLQEVDLLIAHMQTIRQVLEDSMRCNCLTLDACAQVMTSHHAWRIDDASTEMIPG